MDSNNYDQYSEYLGNVSFHARIYRRFYLHPSFKKHLMGRVLDVGSGIGDFVYHHGNAAGLEINPNLVSYSQSRSLDVRLLENNIFPFLDNSFDSVLLDNVLEHLEHPETTLIEIKRVLKPNSNFVAVVPGIKGYAQDDDHKVFYDEKILTELMSKYNFTEFKMLHTPFKSSWLSTNVSAYCIYGVYKNEK